MAAGDYSGEDVSLGEDADYVVLVGDDEAADAESGHETGGVFGGLGCVDGVDVPDHDVLDVEGHVWFGGCLWGLMGIVDCCSGSVS